MRILHFSDVHIGVENFGRAATEADLAALPDCFAPGMDAAERERNYLGVSTRLLDFLGVLDQVVDFAIKERVDLALFCGDAYKSRDPSQTQQREFARRIAYLVAKGVPVFLVAGNHDTPMATGRATALEIFPTLRVPGIAVGDRVAIYRMETRSGPLQVLAVPWVRRGALLSRPEHRAKTPEELRRHIEEELARRILVEAERLDRSLPAVLAGHVTVAGAVTSSEVSMTLGRDHVLPLSTVALPGIDYVALGHVHKHQQLGAAPPVVYSGSLQRVDFSEERDVKGFCLVELDPRVPTGSRARWEFVPLAARPFVTINVEVHPDEEPTAAVLREIARTHVAGAIVRVQVRLPEALEGRLDERAVRQALGQAHSIAALTRDVTRQRRPRIGMETRGLTPEEALRRYLDQAQRDLSPQQKERLLQRGLALIQEESSRQGSP